MRFITTLTALLLCAAVQPASAQPGACPLLGPNLIVNGNFEQGYYGFTSDFGRGLNNATKGGCATQGWILVTQTNPHVSPACQIYPPALSAQYGPPNTPTSSDPNDPSNTSVVTLAVCNNPLDDHTTGKGFFLTIDPDAVAGRAYWKQTVAVCPNTNYEFSVWVRNVEPGCGKPAPLFHFEVGGVPINAPTSYPDCFWMQTAALWNSGTVNGNVLIELINDQPGCIANDVAIDDVFFGICGGAVLTSDPYFRFCGESPGMPILLTADVLGFAPPQFQWQKFDPATGAWTNIPGATDSVYRIAAPTPADAGFYRLVGGAAGNAGNLLCAVASAVAEIEASPEYATTDTVHLCTGASYAGYSAPGVYTDTLLSVDGCDSVRTLHLYVHDPYRVEQQVALCQGVAFDFNGHALTATGRYTDTLSSLYGCDSIVVLDLQFLPNREWTGDSAYCYLPNVFSPNDDGVNDFFVPAFPALDFQAYHFEVYDRWGSLLFSTNDPSAGWDGRHRGRDCAAGVYAYVLTLKTKFCERVAFTGAVCIIR